METLFLLAGTALAFAVSWLFILRPIYRTGTRSKKQMAESSPANKLSDS